jgi:putative transposase
MLNGMASGQTRTAIRPMTLTGYDYRRAHEAAHLAAGLWNQAVQWTRQEWDAGRKPGKYDIQSFLTALPAGERPLHAHTTEMIAHDLWDAIKTSRALRRQGIKTRAPWRHKNYRPLSFSKGFGWRIAPDGSLALSLGRGRPRIVLPLPRVEDSATGELVDVSRWGEIHLCWDQDARQWSLHIPYETVREVAPGENVIAIDEGIINPMALATWADESTIEVTVINGREARAIKRGRNKAVGKIQKKLSKMKNGSKRHRRLVAAKKRVKARAQRQLRDFDHQVARQAANFAGSHQALRIVVGDVRGIERKTKKELRAGRHLRQQLSQWSRGTQERYLSEKAGLEILHINESGSTKTCPQCLTSNRPSGRHYRCQNPACGFTCHRDAVGATNILQKAIHGEYLPIGADTKIRVTYLRAVDRWSQDQRQAHRQVQRRKARALSIAPNRALPQATVASKRVPANPSTSASAPGPLATVA